MRLNTLNWLLLSGLMPAFVSMFLVHQFGVIRFRPVQTATIVYLVISYIPFFAILLLRLAHSKSLLARVDSYSKSCQIRSIHVKSIAFRSFLFITIIYIAVSLYDAFLIRNISVFNLTEARLLANREGERGSVLGAITLLLSGAPIIFLSLFYMMNQQSKGRNPFSFWLLVIGCLVGFTLVLSGGRNPVVISLLMIGVTLVLARQAGFINSPVSTGVKRWIRKYGYPIALSIPILWVSFYFFVERGLYRSHYLGSALTMFQYEYGVDFRHSIGSGTEVSTFDFVAAMLSYYIAHPAQALSDQMLLVGCRPTFGSTSFYNGARILDTIFGTDFAAQSVLSRHIVGIYYSLPGTLYIDYCYIGVIIFWLVVIITLISIDLTLSGNHRWLFAAGFLITCLIFSPFYSVFTIGNGFSLFVMAAITTFLPPFGLGRRAAGGGSHESWTES